MPAKKIIQRETPKVGLHETIIPYEEVVEKLIKNLSLFTAM